MDSALHSNANPGWQHYMISVAMGAPALLLLFASLLRLSLWWSMWWERMRIREMMRRQGITGPPITLKNFFTGHAKEILESRQWEQAQPELKPGTHDMLSSTQSFAKTCRKRYGNPFLFWWGADATISTTNVEVVKAVLVSKFNSFTPSAQLRKNRGESFGQHGLLSQANGHRWARQRELLSPAFDFAKLKGMVGLAIDISATLLVEEWHQKIEQSPGGCEAEIEVSDAMSRVSADALARTAFGSSYKRGHEIFNLSTELGSLTTNNAYYSALPFYKYLPTKRNRRLAQTLKALEDKIRLTVEERLKCGGGDQEKDLLDYMIKASRELGPHAAGSEPGEVSLQYLLDESRNFYYAGHESTNGNLQWTMMLLALYPEWQDKCTAEVDQVTQGTGCITGDMISKLKVMSMVLSESLRLYPASSNLTRQAVEDVRVGNLLIPKGVCIHISLLAMHTLPEIWGQDALEFKPERFKDGAMKACANPVAYLPFSRGPRGCIGQEYTMVANKTVLAKILQNFRFSLSPQYRHFPHVPQLLKPKYGVPLRVTRR